MPEDPPTPPPETPEPRRAGQNVGAAFAGETTRSISEPSPTPPSADSTTLSEDGTVLRPTTQQREVIGDFEIISKLGQGGMGAVYRARQVSLDRQVALKILPATLEADADFVSRFQREARVAASLSHGNLVKVFSSGQADGCHFIAMELIEGETLGQWLKRSGALPPQEALRICADVARALEHGWNRAQLIHRDIKPGNIFLSIHGDVKVGDLGLAKTLGGDTTGLTHTGTAMGTPHYISPEQARGDKDLDFRADIYSLGCTLYQMLTGRTPYEGRDPVSVMHQHIHGPPPAILKVLPSCPIPLARLVGKMLKKVKRERHTSYAELLAQIDGVQALFAPTESALESTLPPNPDALLATPGQTPRSGSATPASAPMAPPSTRPAPTGPKSKAGLYGAIAAGVVALGAVAFFAWPREEPLTKAQIYNQQLREAEARTAAAAAVAGVTDPGPPASVTLPTTAQPAWVKLDLSQQTIFNGEKIIRDGHLHLGRFAIWSSTGVPAFKSMRDCAIRFRWTVTDEKGGGQVFLRVPENGTGGFTIEGLNQTGFYLKRDGTHFPGGQKHGDKPKAGETIEFQFALVGSQFLAWRDGRFLGPAALPADLNAPGSCRIQATGSGCVLESIELLNLDGLPEAEALRLAGVAPAPGAAPQWRKIVITDDQLGDKAKRGPEGEIVLDGFWKLPGPEARDVAIRAEVRPEPGSTSLPVFRLRGKAGRARTLRIQPTAALLQADNADGKFARLASQPLPRSVTDAEWQPILFATVGPWSLGFYGGDPVFRGTSDLVLHPGDIHFSGKGHIRNLEVLVLDGLAEAEALRLVGVAPAASGSSPAWAPAFPELASLPEVAGVQEGWARFKPEARTIRVRAEGDPEKRWRNAGIRARLRPSEAGAPASLNLQLRRGPANLELHYYPGKTPEAQATVVIRRYDLSTKVSTVLAEVPVAPVHGAPAGYLLEFLAIERTLIARLNGQPLIITRLPDPYEVAAGGLALHDLPKSEARDAEFLNLDGLPEAEALRLAGVAPVAASIPDDALTHGGHRYALVPGKYMWDEARAEAAKAGGHLAVITSAEEDRFLRDTLTRLHPGGDRIRYWIGAHAPKGDSSFEWIIGSPFTFTAWGSNEPNDHRNTPGKAHRVYYARDRNYGLPEFAWADASDNDANRTGYIIEWPAATSADTATFGGHRYQFVPGLITWAEAKAKAEDMGGYLATLTSEAEERWVHEQFVAPRALSSENKHLYCVGSFAEEGSPDFRWITGEPMGKIRWRKGNPNWRELENNSSKSYGGVRFAAGVAMGKEDNAGWFNVVPSVRSQVGGFLVEWDDAGPATTPTAATKDAPFVNALGMKFVPVPIIGGPTDGQRVLFSIWETRVQDYEVFATETKRDWPKPGFPQEPTHPAVMISMTEAAAFCDWLTARERAAGKLGKNETYRLPSDHEWSCAVGIGEREDAAKTPEEKDAGLPDVYAWGSTWPPPPGAGNYNGMETEGKALKHLVAPLKDYRDDFPTTAPVGSFPPNRWGLQDPAGNVWEWCENLFRPGGTTRVLRGAAFSDNSAAILRLSHRIDRGPGHQSDFMGFRVVLAPAP